MFYKVWLQNEYFEKFPIFEKIEATEFENWLFENASLNDGLWWLDGSTYDSVVAPLGVPVNSMGYLVKFEKVVK